MSSTKIVVGCFSLGVAAVVAAGVCWGTTLIPDAAVAADQQTPGQTYILEPCPMEDSDNCYWDAAHMGNGTGHSFVVIEGRYFYAEDGK